MAIGGLRRMPEIDHVAVLNDVVLPLEAQLGVIAARGEGAPRQQVLVANPLRPDEPARDIAVDFPRREHGGRVAWNGPGAVLVLADGEKRDVAEKIVAGANHSIESGFAEP